jgi:hypothetical protein
VSALHGGICLVIQRHHRRVHSFQRPAQVTPSKAQLQSLFQLIIMTSVQQPPILNSTFACGAWAGQSFSVGAKSFDAWCHHDTTGPVLSVTSSTLYDCAVACAGSNACKAVSWVFGTCYQKSAIGDIIPNEYVTSFVITIEDQPVTGDPALQCPADDGAEYNGFTVGCSTDYFGIGDIGSSIQPSLESCIDECSSASSRSCMAVVYAGNVCYKKDKTGPVTTNKRTTAAVKKSLSNGPAISSPKCPDADGTTITLGGSQFKVYCDREYFGGDLTFAEFDTFGECVEACANNPDCIDVSYTGVACYMKKELTTLAPAPRIWTAQLIARSAEVPAEPDAPSQFQCPFTESRYYTIAGVRYQVDCGKDYFGGDLKALDTTTAERCMDACTATPGCTAASYRGSGCYLKTALNTAINDEGVLGMMRVANMPTTSSSMSSTMSSTTNVPTMLSTSVTTTLSTMISSAPTFADTSASTSTTTTTPYTTTSTSSPNSTTLTSNTTTATSSTMIPTSNHVMTTITTSTNTTTTTTTTTPTTAAVRSTPAIAPDLPLTSTRPRPDSQKQPAPAPASPTPFASAPASSSYGSATPFSTAPRSSTPPVVPPRGQRLPTMRRAWNCKWPGINSSTS